jgi:hypothetical protein
MKSIWNRIKDSSKTEKVLAAIVIALIIVIIW